MRRAVVLSLHRRHSAAFFELRLLSAARVLLEFGEREASIRVRLLIKCGFYTRFTVYGSAFEIDHA